MSNSKRCTCCREIKPLSLFGIRNSSKGSLQSRCKQCFREYNARRYAEKRELIRAQVDAWQEKNRERYLEMVRAYGVSHRQQYAENLRRRRSMMASDYVFTLVQVDARMAYWGYRCWMCGGPFQEVDHVKPISKHGPHIPANLRPACQPCNGRKSAKWPGVKYLSDFMTQSLENRVHL